MVDGESDDENEWFEKNQQICARNILSDLFYHMFHKKWTTFHKIWFSFILCICIHFGRDVHAHAISTIGRLPRKMLLGNASFFIDKNMI